MSALESPGDELALALLLISPEQAAQRVLAEVLPKVSPDDFARPALRVAWSAARALHDAGTPVTRRRLTQMLPDSDRSAVTRLLDSLGADVWDYPAAISAADIVPKLARQRRIESVLTEARSQLEAGTDPTAWVTSALGDLDATSDPRLKHISDTLTDWWTWNDVPHDQHRVIPTPWHQADDFLAGGLHTARTYVIAARPGMGKSIVLTNCAAHAAAHGHGAVVFSAEMPAREVTSRILADQASVSYARMTRRSLDDAEVAGIAEYTDRAKDMPLWICDQSHVSVGEITRMVRDLKKHHPIDVVCVDYLQLLKPEDRRAPREQQVAAMSRGLKILARDLDVAVVIACQLNRQSSQGKPQLHDLRESGAIEQDCDVAILLWHETTGDGEPTGMVSFVYAKNRTGRLGESALRWAPWHARIESGARS